MGSGLRVGVTECLYLGKRVVGVRGKRFGGVKWGGDEVSGNARHWEPCTGEVLDVGETESRGESCEGTHGD